MFVHVTTETTMSEYSREDLNRDLYLMVKAGLLNVHMREDGEWIFSVTEESKTMTDEERAERVNKIIEEEGNNDY